jgi:predicted nuclease of predicted toxin-antitoxin system
VKFLVDMPVTPAAADHFGRTGHAASVGLATVSDPEILDVARRKGRVIVTADLDYLPLLRKAAVWLQRDLRQLTR